MAFRPDPRWGRIRAISPSTEGPNLDHFHRENRLAAVADPMRRRHHKKKGVPLPAHGWFMGSAA
jgi:hypothetical protein